MVIVIIGSGGRFIKKENQKPVKNILAMAFSLESLQSDQPALRTHVVCEYIVDCRLPDIFITFLCVSSMSSASLKASSRGSSIIDCATKRKKYLGEAETM